MFWNESVHGATKTSDFFDQARAYIEVRFLGHHENGFNTIVEFSIHVGHLQFVLEIADGTKAAQEHVALTTFCVIYEQSFKGIDFDFVARKRFADHCDAFFETEKWLFLNIDRDSDDDLVKNSQTALDNTNVATGQGIEAARIDRNSHS